MIPRKRFLQIARFQRPNDAFIFGIGGWNETYRRWIREGMPTSTKANEIHDYLLGSEDKIAFVKPNAGGLGLGENGSAPWVPPLNPFFEPSILREEDNHIVTRGYDGSIARVNKHDVESSMPQWLEFPVKNKYDWNEYKKRLDPFTLERYPPGWNIVNENIPLGMICLTLFSGPRRYAMGLENLCIAIFEDLSLVEEMIEWYMYFGFEMLKTVMNSGVHLDFAWISEDICYKNGPLISPDFVKKYMAPNYRKVVDYLRSKGVDIIMLDSDGDVSKLLPIWLDCGINGTYPLEVASGMDAIKLRNEYGNELIMFGNIDKRALTKGKREIDDEIRKVETLLEYGGYFPCVDHMIPPDVSYENIKYFVSEIRKFCNFSES